MREPLLVATVLASMLASVLSGQDKPEPVLAVRGLDPVELCAGKDVAGKKELVGVRGRYLYRFATPENQKRFLADPGRFGIQWGGACARMGPLSGRGSPDRWAVHDGRIYIFASDGCRKGFLKAPHRFVVAKPEAPKATAKDLEAGRAMIERIVAAHGGAKAIDGRRALRLRDEGRTGNWEYVKELIVTAGGAVQRHTTYDAAKEADTKEPDTREANTRKRYDSRWVVAEAAFSTSNGNANDLQSPDEREDVLRFGHRQPILILWARTRDGFRAVPQGKGRLEKREVQNLWVECDGLSTTLHLDPKDSRILGLSWRGRLGEGITRDVTETFTKWQQVAGVLVPVARELTLDGKISKPLSGAWDRVELLEKEPDEAFRRPAKSSKKR